MKLVPQISLRRRFVVRVAAWSALLIVVVLGLCLFFAPGLLLRSLPAGISHADYKEAATAFELISRKTPSENDVFFHLLQRAVNQDNWATALSCAEPIPSTHPQYGHRARYAEWQILIEMRRANDAEQVLREFIRRERGSPQLPPMLLQSAEQSLSKLLFVELRLEERHELLRQMCQRRDVAPSRVLEFHFRSSYTFNHEQLIGRANDLLKQDADNLVLRIAAGRFSTLSGQLPDARKILEQCVRDQPQHLSANAALLECLFELGDWQEIEIILQRLPPFDHGEPWLLSTIRGRFHNRRKRYRSAVKCFSNVLKDDQTNIPCHVGLAEAYRGLKNQTEQELALKRVNVLTRIQSRLTRAVLEPEEPDVFREIVKLCEEANLVEPAVAVAGLLLRLKPDDLETQEILQRLKRHADLPIRQHNQ